MLFKKLTYNIYVIGFWSWLLDCKCLSKITYEEFISLPDEKVRLLKELRRTGKVEILRLSMLNEYAALREHERKEYLTWARHVYGNGSSMTFSEFKKLPKTGPITQESVISSCQTAAKQRAGGTGTGSSKSHTWSYSSSDEPQNGGFDGIIGPHSADIVERSRWSSD